MHVGMFHTNTANYLRVDVYRYTIRLTHKMLTVLYLSV